MIFLVRILIFLGKFCRKLLFLLVGLIGHRFLFGIFIKKIQKTKEIVLRRIFFVRIGLVIIDGWFAIIVCLGRDFVVNLLGSFLGFI